MEPFSNLGIVPLEVIGGGEDVSEDEDGEA